jgi:putative tryptophan/tyrosine transport system substrate-binding protein
MRRRELILAIGGAAYFCASAGHAESLRTVAVLTSLLEQDPQWQIRFDALRQGLRAFGWREGENIRLTYRNTGADPSATAEFARELVALQPEVIVSGSSTISRALQQATRSIPIIFVNAADPVSSGLVGSLAHPGGNLTGIASFELSLSGKWLGLLKEIAPELAHVMVIYTARAPAWSTHLEALEHEAHTLNLTITRAGLNDPSEIEPTLASIAAQRGSGLAVLTSQFATAHRAEILRAANRYRLPAIFGNVLFAREGGLMAYGGDQVEPYRRAAWYVDRLLRGDKAADLPVEQATKLQFIINLKTAKALGLAIPPTLLARADEVIE